MKCNGCAFTSQLLLPVEIITVAIFTEFSMTPVKKRMNQHKQGSGDLAADTVLSTAAAIGSWQRETVTVFVVSGPVNPRHPSRTIQREICQVPATICLCFPQCKLQGIERAHTQNCRGLTLQWGRFHTDINQPGSTGWYGDTNRDSLHLIKGAFQQFGFALTFTKNG